MKFVDVEDTAIFGRAHRGCADRLLSQAIAPNAIRKGFGLRVNSASVQGLQCRRLVKLNRRMQQSVFCAAASFITRK